MTQRLVEYGKMTPMNAVIMSMIETKNQNPISSYSVATPEKSDIFGVTTV